MFIHIPAFNYSYSYSTPDVDAARVENFKNQLSPLTQMGFPVTHKNKHILLKKFFSRMKIHIGIFEYAFLMDNNPKNLSF